jgi:hypothetical protein
MRRDGVLTRSGLKLEDPHLTIAWSIRPAELRELFRESGQEGRLRFVTEGYFVLSCTALAGLETQLGLHFRPRSEAGRLAELEFFDNGQQELKASYELYQQHLERVFGPPSRSRAGLSTAQLPTHEWRTRGLRVSHYVMERFGPEEHVRVTRMPWLSAWLG